MNDITPSEISSLHTAAFYGFDFIIEDLLAKGASINSLDALSCTPLHLAIKSNSDSSAELLLQRGASVDIANIDGEFPLHIAVKNNNYTVTNLILEKHADVNAVTRENITPFYIAASRKNIRTCELLLEYGADVNISDKDGMSPLHLLIQPDNYALVRLLLDCEAMVNKKTIKGITPIYLSTAKGCEDLFVLLLKYGAEIDLNFVSGNKNILQLAVFRNCPIIVEHILKHCDVVKENYDDLLSIAVVQGKVKIANALLDFGFRIHESDVQNEDLVKAVIENGHLEIFKDLLKYKLDVNMRLRHSAYENILHLAIDRGRKDFVSLLISHKADVHITDFRGRSTLTYAVHAKSSNLEIVQMLLDESNMDHFVSAFQVAVSLNLVKIVETMMQHSKFASLLCAEERMYDIFDTDIRPDEHGTKLSLKPCFKKDLLDGFLNAVYYDHIRIVKMLLPLVYPLVNCILYRPKDTICRSFIKNVVYFNNGEPARQYSSFLLIAAARGSHLTVEQLLKWGSDVNCRNEFGLTALHFAILRDDSSSTVKVLLKYGATIDCKADNGMTPLHLAAILKRGESLKLLIKNCADINVTDENNRTFYYYMVKMPTNTQSEEIWQYQRLTRDWAKDRDCHYELDSDSEYESEEDDVTEIFTIFQDKAPVFLQRHILKLKVADLFLNDVYWHLRLDRNSLDFQKKCELEIATMKNDIINESTITFYDILTCSADQLVKFMKIEDFFKSVKTSAWRERYPAYKHMIRAKLRRAEIHKNLEEKMKAIIPNVFPLYSSLPALCLEKICNYLSLDFLRRIMFIKPETTSEQC